MCEARSAGSFAQEPLPGSNGSDDHHLQSLVASKYCGYGRDMECTNNLEATHMCSTRRKHHKWNKKWKANDGNGCANIIMLESDS